MEERKDNMMLDSVPSDVMSDVLRKKTSLGHNPAIPDLFDEDFLERMVRKAFKRVCNDIRAVDIESFDIDTLNRLIKEAQDRERNIRPQLEQICYNHIIDLFNVPTDEVDVEMSLIDKVNPERSSIILDPVDGDDDFEFADIVDAESIKGEVYKRRLLDVLVMGASICISSNVESYESKIHELDDELPELYKKICTLNSYLLFVNNFELTEDDKKQIGVVEVTLGNDIKKTKIDSEGLIFPVLLSETLRGFLELSISHGLPDDIERAKAIIGKSDFLKNEPWDMRLGPVLWTLLSDGFWDTDTTTIPYLLYILSKQPVKMFNKMFNEIFAKTRKGKVLINRVLDKALDLEDNVGSDSGIEKKNNRRAMIVDNIDPDEL